MQIDQQLQCDSGMSSCQDEDVQDSHALLQVQVKEHIPRSRGGYAKQNGSTVKRNKLRNLVKQLMKSHNVAKSRDDSGGSKGVSSELGHNSRSVALSQFSETTQDANSAGNLIIPPLPKDQKPKVAPLVPMKEAVNMNLLPGIVLLVIFVPIFLCAGYSYMQWRRHEQELERKEKDAAMSLGTAASKG